MNENCPTCRSLVTFFAHDVGRTIECRSCGAAFKVEPDGLRLLVPGEAPPPPPPSPSPAQTEKPPPASWEPERVSLLPASSSNSSTSMKDFATWIFLFGIVLVLVFLSLPQIDEKRVRKLDAARDEARIGYNKDKKALERTRETKLEAANEKLNELNKGRNDLFKERDKATDPKERDKVTDKINKLEKEIAEKNEDIFKLNNYETDEFKKEMKKLRDQEKEINKTLDKIDIEDRPKVFNSNLKASYWYKWGLMIGLVLVSIACLGYLSPNQTLVRRIVGAIVIVNIFWWAIVTMVIR